MFHSVSWEVLMSKRSLAIGLPAGVAFGAGVGAATDDMGVWVGVGVALGFAFATALNKRMQNAR
jgi:hypothetical protein